MYSVIHQNLEPKIAAFGSTLLSSLAVNVNPTIRNVYHEQNLSTFDPIHFFNEWSKSRNFNFRDTKIVHAHVLRTHVFHFNVFFANSLLDSYCRSAEMEYAHSLFEEIPKRNTVSWNVLISGYNHNSLYEGSWRAFCWMHSSGFDPNQFTYGSVLSACTALQSPIGGKQVYALATKNGFFSNGYVRVGMIDLFAKSGTFEDALTVFYDGFCENVVCWNAIISGAVKNKKYNDALELFSPMYRSSLLPNSYTFSSILTACASLEELELGKAIQCWVIKCGAEDIFVGTSILDLYAKCGAMGNAMKQFLLMPIRNVVSWTAVISGFVQRGDFVSALELFKKMRKTEETNIYTVTSVVIACADSTMTKEAFQIHCWLYKTGFYMDSAVKASLINMYSKIRELEFSEKVFEETNDVKNLGIWTAMISGCAQSESSWRAIGLFMLMLRLGVKPDKFCCSSVLSIIECLNLGRNVHCFTLKSGLNSDLSVGCSLFTMYSKCGSLDESYQVFERIVDRDNVSWGSMISGFAEHRCEDRAVELFREMLLDGISPDETTLMAVLIASSALNSMKTGKEIHGYALRRGFGHNKIVGGALVSFYSKCGVLVLSKRVFEMMPFKDQILCSSLASGLAQNGYIREAIELFREMLKFDFEIDSFTISSVLGAVSQLSGSNIGNQLHSCIIKKGLESDVSVGSSLVTMHSKCGNIEDCLKSFDRIVGADLIGWTAMISSYAQNGKGLEAIELYEKMRTSGIKPDEVTFIGLLSACSHNGLVEEGYFYLNSMIKDYKMEPSYRHYACMVDILGRSGRLEEAEGFIEKMPIRANGLIWGTLLSACRVHGDVEMGRRAAERVIELEPCDSGAYVSLSNIWADLGRWEEVIKIRHKMEGSGAKKEPGWSYL